MWTLPCWTSAGVSACVCRWWTRPLMALYIDAGLWLSRPLSCPVAWVADALVLSDGLAWEGWQPRPKVLVLFINNTFGHHDQDVVYCMCLGRLYVELYVYIPNSSYWYKGHKKKKSSAVHFSKMCFWSRNVLFKCFYMYRVYFILE